MALQLILGRSGSGKTNIIYNKLIEKSLSDSSSPLILIVPEQFTLQTQQELLSKHPRHGIMNIEILSFQRLAYRLSDDLDLADRTLLKDTGMSMVIRKLVEDNKEKYPIIYPNIKKRGYIKELKGLITEFYQYNFEESVFEKIQKEVDNLLLKEKIKDAQQLYSDFKNFLNDKYLTSENTLDLLVGGIEANKWLNEAEIYIDGFYGFTPVQYNVISQLLNKAKNVSVAVTIEIEEMSVTELDNNSLFYESKKIINQLSEIVKKEKLSQLNSILLDNQPRFINSPEIAHIEQNIYRYPNIIFKDKPKNIHLCKASNMRKEVRYVADSIMKLVMEKNYRFLDIAVVTGDLEGYEGYLKQIFARYDIPFFMDHKKNIMEHPLVELINSVLDVFIYNFSYESIFRYLKTGLHNIEYGVLDRLENYVLAYGIRGINSWQSVWDKSLPLLRIDKDNEYVQNIIKEMNKVREYIIKPLSGLGEIFSQKDITISQIAFAIYSFLKELDIEEKINKLETQFEIEGELLYQREYSQIYSIVMDVFEQIAMIIGEQAITIKDFSELLKAGLEECEMGLVPPGLDQVVIGDLERTRLKETKALFVIGFNEGKVPKVMEQASIITDYERTELKEAGIELAPDNKENIFKEQFNIYMSLTRVSQKIYLSYSKSNNKGKSIRPSMLFNAINRMFENTSVLDVDELYENRIIVNTPDSTFYNFIGNIDIIKEANCFEAKEICMWFYKHEPWKYLLRTARNALDWNNNEPVLSPESINMLYGETLNNSVSRLETYAKCPFAHFIDYGLHLNERLDYVIKMPDIGILFHRAIDTYSKKVNKLKLDWKSIDEKTRNLLVKEAVTEVVNNEQRGLFNYNARSRFLLKRLIRITGRAVWAIGEQISKGDFRPIDFEYNFDASKQKTETLTIDFDSKKSLNLNGRIDRVDAYEDNDELYLSVIDYKSGNQKFDMVALYYGLQLQLLVYLNAVTEIKRYELKQENKKIIPAGIFYFHIDDPLIKDVANRKPDYLKAMILKELKLKGLVLDQQQIIKKFDQTIEKSSDIIPVSLTNQGEISKSSSVASIEQFECLKQFANGKIKDIGQSIINGNLSIKPYKRKKETGCDYCKYLSICQFEKNLNNNSYNELKEITKSEFWGKIMEEVKNN